MKHADETTWSCDGRHGCAWGFFTALVSPCRLRGTRGASVAAEVFGDGPHVGARKVCFGSQSEKGLKTRETLMSVIDTLKLRCDDPVRKLSGVFDALARDRDADVSALLWGAARP